MSNIDVLFFSPVISPPEVSIISDGIPLAGEMYTLLCRVIVQEGSVSEADIIWLNPDGEPLTSEGEITVAIQPAIGNPTRLTTYALHFSPVYTSRGGIYTCQATVTSPFQTFQETGSATTSLSIRSRLLIHTLSA